MSKFSAIEQARALSVAGTGSSRELALTRPLGPDPSDLPVLKLWQAIEARLADCPEKVIQITACSDVDEDHSVAHRLARLASRAMQGGVLLLNALETEMRVDDDGLMGLGPLPGRNGDMRAYNPRLLGEFWDNLRTQAQLIILDTPPILDSPLSQAMAPTVHGVVLVIEAEKTTERQAKAAKDALEKSGACILGIVLNKQPRHIPKALEKRL